VSDQVPDEEPVLLVDRQVKVELVPDVGEKFRRRGRPAPGRDQRRVARNDEKDQVGDERRDDEEEDRPEEAANEKASHLNGRSGG
jgi:hypothetical protein